MGEIQRNIALAAGICLLGSACICGAEYIQEQRLTVLEEAAETDRDYVTKYSGYLQEYFVEKLQSEDFASEIASRLGVGEEILARLEEAGLGLELSQEQQKEIFQAATEYINSELGRNSTYNAIYNAAYAGIYGEVYSRILNSYQDTDYTKVYTYITYDVDSIVQTVTSKLVNSYSTLEAGTAAATWSDAAITAWVSQLVEETVSELKISTGEIESVENTVYESVISYLTGNLGAKVLADGADGVSYFILDGEKRIFGNTETEWETARNVIMNFVSDAIDELIHPADGKSTIMLNTIMGDSITDIRIENGELKIYWVENQTGEEYEESIEMEDGLLRVVTDVELAGYAYGEDALYRELRVYYKDAAEIGSNLSVNTGSGEESYTVIPVENFASVYTALYWETVINLVRYYPIGANITAGSISVGSDSYVVFMHDCDGDGEDDAMLVGYTESGRNIAYYDPLSGELLASYNGNDNDVYYYTCSGCGAEFTTTAVLEEWTHVIKNELDSVALELESLTGVESLVSEGEYDLTAISNTQEYIVIAMAEFHARILRILYANPRYFYLMDKYLKYVPNDSLFPDMCLIYSWQTGSPVFQNKYEDMVSKGLWDIECLYTGILLDGTETDSYYTVEEIYEELSQYANYYGTYYRISLDEITADGKFVYGFELLPTMQNLEEIVNAIPDYLGKDGTWTTTTPYRYEAYLEWTGVKDAYEAYENALAAYIEAEEKQESHDELYEAALELQTLLSGLDSGYLYETGEYKIDGISFDATMAMFYFITGAYLNTDFNSGITLGEEIEAYAQLMEQVYNGIDIAVIYSGSEIDGETDAFSTFLTFIRWISGINTITFQATTTTTDSGTFLTMTEDGKYNLEDGTYVENSMEEILLRDLCYIRAEFNTESLTWEWTAEWTDTDTLLKYEEPISIHINFLY